MLTVSMVERAYVPGLFEPPDRAIVRIRVSGRWHTAAYRAGDDPAFFVWIPSSKGWLEVDPAVECWSQRPPKPRAGESADEIYSRQRLPWWLRESTQERRRRHRDDKWWACEHLGQCSRCREAGGCELR